MPRVPLTYLNEIQEVHCWSWWNTAMEEDRFWFLVSSLNQSTLWLWTSNVSHTMAGFERQRKDGLFCAQKAEESDARKQGKKNLCFFRTSPTIFHVNCWLCFRFLTKTQITPKLYPHPKFITYSGKIFDEQYCTTSISILTVLPQLSLLASGLIGSS